MARAPHRTRSPVSGQRGLTLHLRRATRQGRVPGVAALRQWATLALGRRARGRELSVLVVGPARSRSLNHRYRGQDHATNVLTFDYMEKPVRADIVICVPVVRAEARAQSKTFRDHLAHLLLHGILHAQGHDHATHGQARRMEGRERRLLARLHIADPYR